MWHLWHLFYLLQSVSTNCEWVDVPPSQLYVIKYFQKFGPIVMLKSLLPIHEPQVYLFLNDNHFCDVILNNQTSSVVTLLQFQIMLLESDTLFSLLFPCTSTLFLTRCHLISQFSRNKKNNESRKTHLGNMNSRKFRPSLKQKQREEAC